VKHERGVAETVPLAERALSTDPRGRAARSDDDVRLNPSAPPPQTAAALKGFRCTTRAICVRSVGDLSLAVTIASLPNTKHLPRRSMSWPRRAVADERQGCNEQEEEMLVSPSSRS